MTDEKIEKVKSFLSQFKDLNDFIENYINVNKPANAEVLIQFYKETKSNSDAWEMAKFQRSIESLRIDKLLRDEQSITIDDIVTTAKKYDLSKYKRIIIKLDNKSYDDIDKLSELGLDVFIKVKGDVGICTLEEFKKMREFFDSFTQRTLSYNLSMLEKITLAYDYVKFFSYNAEQTDRLTDSRSIAKSLTTGYIVCAGYSRIFCQLLNEMGINSFLVSIKPNKKYSGGHTRVMINVKDEKYNIGDVFAFDPTWDSAMNMALVNHSDGSSGYETSSSIKPDDTIIERLPSDIRYLFFMVPLHEYSKYFPEEEIERIEKYPTMEKIEMPEALIKLLNYNDHMPRDSFIYDIINDLLLKTKKVEGYPDDQIAKHIDYVIDILEQDRFGRLDKYASQTSNHIK